MANLLRVLIASVHSCSCLTLKVYARKGAVLWCLLDTFLYTLVEMLILVPLNIASLGSLNEGSVNL